MDANAHLNNVALDAMHENARATMSQGLRDSGLFDRGLRLVNAQRPRTFLPKRTGQR